MLECRTVRLGMFESPKPLAHMTSQEIAAGIADLGPWFYPFEFAGGLRTESAIPSEVTGIFETRLQMANALIDSHFAGRLPQASCLDVGCHEGFYTVAMARKGLGRIVGIDVREESLRKARFVADAMGLQGVEFQQANCERLETRNMGAFDL